MTVTMEQADDSLGQLRTFPLANRSEAEGLEFATSIQLPDIYLVDISCMRLAWGATYIVVCGKNHNLSLCSLSSFLSQCNAFFL